MLVAVAIADLLGTEMTGICYQVFQALGQGCRYTQLLALSTGLRLLAALWLAGAGLTPLRWSYLYAASSVIATACGVVAVSCCCAKPRVQLNLLIPSVREGFHFATSLGSQSVYDDIDKTMLARLSTVESAAIFAVAYRFIEAAMLPIRSVATATYPEFFRQGVHGVTSAFEFARRILRYSLVYGIAIALVLFLGAGLVPLVMGPAYAESAVALRWLCVLPCVKSVHAFLTDTLTGANYQWQRSSTQFAIAGFNVLVNLWVIPAYAWRGAAWSSLLTHTLLMAVLYIIIRWHLKREQPVVNSKAPQAVFAVEEE
jgi:O-antigen/teichoic acid export membrane protein